MSTDPKGKSKATAKTLHLHDAKKQLRDAARKKIDDILAKKARVLEKVEDARSRRRASPTRLNVYQISQIDKYFLPSYKESYEYAEQEFHKYFLAWSDKQDKSYDDLVADDWGQWTIAGCWSFLVEVWLEAADYARTDSSDSINLLKDVIQLRRAQVLKIMEQETKFTEALVDSVDKIIGPIIAKDRAEVEKVKGKAKK
ncbi:MAG: hypothetical protein Q9218_006976 [Villophora microphyllina]